VKRDGHAPFVVKKEPRAAYVGFLDSGHLLGLHECVWFCMNAIRVHIDHFAILFTAARIGWLVITRADKRIFVGRKTCHLRFKSVETLLATVCGRRKLLHRQAP
jgi:hypothetical protein